MIIVRMRTRTCTHSHTSADLVKYNLYCIIMIIYNFYAPPGTLKIIIICIDTAIVSSIGKELCMVT